MKAEQGKKLQLNWTYLVENLEESVVEVLYELQALELIDRERIRGEPSRPDRVIKCLDILMAKPDEKPIYDQLLTALEHQLVRQPHIKRRLEETNVPEEFSRDAAADQERMLEAALKECLVHQKDVECPVDRVIKVVRVQLRRQKRSLEVRTAEVLSLVRALFPQMTYRKNKRKHPVALKNCAIKPEFIHVAENNEEEEEAVEAACAVPMSQITARQVAEVMRAHLEREGQDVNLADRMLEEDIDGKALMQLTEAHIERLFKDLKMGQRIRLMEVVRAVIAELQKPPEIVVRSKPREHLPPRKLETFRPFDTRPRATEVYDRGHVLPEEQSRPGFLLETLHKYSTIRAGELNSLSAQAIQFAAACMNERVNGTIHFGVVGKYDAGRTASSPKPGEIVGLPVDKEQCEVAITEEIYRAFYDDQREMALKCIRDPGYIPVRAEDHAGPELFVVEVDIVPKSSVVGNQAFFLKAESGNRSILYRYVDGGPSEISGKEQERFMDDKRKLFDLRTDLEKTTRTPQAPIPDLHRKLHGLLTEGNDIEVTDIFPVLFLSPMTGSVTSEALMKNFCCIKSLEPLSVFDFNPPAISASEESHSLHSLMENQLGQVYEVLTTDNFDKDSPENRKDDAGLTKLLESIAVSSFKPWIFCNGYGPLEKEELKLVTWRNQRGQGFKEAVRFYREQIPTDKARIIVLLLSKNYDVLLAALEEIFVRFPDQWILVAESEKVALGLKAELIRGSYVDKEDLEERSVIGMPWSHFNQSIINIFGYSSGTGCVLPTSSGKDSTCVMKERDRNGLPDLEILSKHQCADEDLIKRGIDADIEKKKRTTEEEFYRGKEVSWWNFFFLDHVLKRVHFNKLLDLVKEKLDGKIPDDEKVAVVSLFHQPGAGGTTTARQLLWELKDEYRCSAIKQIPDPRQTSEQITTLRNFEEPENPKPPIVLIDNEDEEKVFQLCSHLNEKARREARDSRGKQKTFCVLLICIRMTVLPKKKDESKVGMMLGHELQTVEAQWFRSKYESLEERFKKKQLGLHPKLLISFNIIKENFSKDYIKRTVNEFISEIKDFKEKRLLKYIALVNSFDPDFQSIPMSCFNVVMCPVIESKTNRPRLGHRKRTRGEIHWEANLSTELNVLLNRTPKLCLGSDIKAVRIINNNLSREILNNLCERDKQKVSDVILEFLHTDVFKRCNDSNVQTQLIKIMKDVLKKRAPQKKGRFKFSPVIMEIGSNEDWDLAAEVLKVGFEKFDDAMIAQQIARVYIHCCNWKCADEYALIAQHMKPRNSYLCDTHGQVFKEQLIGRWKECLESEEQLEGDKARDMIDTAFKAVEIFRREQKLSDEDSTTGYNNCGFFSELRVIVTLLDCCRFLKTFKCDTGQMLHKFLVDPNNVPDGLKEEIGEERIQQLKKLYLEYEKPMRRLEDEQIQLKEDSCYQYSPSYTNSIRDRRMFVHLQECLDTYFGEDNDRVPDGTSKEDACEYRRRRVKRKGGNSLRSIYGLRNEENAVDELKALYAIIKENVVSPYCNAFDLKTILNITMARISKNKRCASETPLQRALEWTQKLYEVSKQDLLPYLESYLYLVMFNWPTEWRNQQGFDMIPCSKLKDIIKEWKEAFQNNHPAQKEVEGKQPDRRKGTTLFFLGQGEGFDEIVFYSELQGFNRRHIGDSIWDTSVAKERLKQLKGTLMHGGGEMSVKIQSPKGSVIQLFIPTSYPIKDHSLWQKSVRFVLGFCWSGPKAYSVTRDDNLDLKHAHTPLSFEATRRNFDSTQQKQMSEQAVEKFWPTYFNNQAELEKIAKDIRLCTNKKLQMNLQKRKKKLEKERELLMQKRTSFLQGPD